MSSVTGEADGPTVPTRVGGYPVREERFPFAERSLRLLRPTDPDAILDEAVELEANVRDDRLPYWAEVWTAGVVLAELLLRDAELMADPVLELGCGLGLSGMAALAMGRHVVFSDYDEAALVFAETNARHNGFADFETFLLDWRRPSARRFPTIIGADLVYERRWHEPLVGVFDAMLAPGGSVLLADPDRKWAPEFLTACTTGGYAATAMPRDRLGPEGRKRKGTVYRIGRRLP